MKNAPLSLDVSYPTLIHVVSEPEGSCDGGYDVECDVQIGQSANNERRWRVQLGVKFKAKGATVAAHRGEVTYVGIFTVVDDFPLEKMYRLIGVDAPSILYSSIRELVALLTGRGPTKTVLLPTVSFIENVVVPSVQSPAGTKTDNVATRAEGRLVKTKKGPPSGSRKSKTARTLAKVHRG
jgi:preprotein translocase subunit SecB